MRGGQRRVPLELSLPESDAVVLEAPVVDPSVDPELLVELELELEEPVVWSSSSRATQKPSTRLQRNPVQQLASSMHHSESTSSSMHEPTQAAGPGADAPGS